MTVGVSKGDPRADATGHRLGAVRHTAHDGQWAITPMGDPMYATAFSMAEDIHDGERWRPVTDAVVIDTDEPFGWVRRTYTFSK